jgi:exopolysaccharide biosynthesis operon protein EpsL
VARRAVFVVGNSRRLLFLGMFVLAGAALAGEGDTFRPLVTYSYGYDSNLFRVENDAVAMLVLGTPIQSETYQSLGIGFDLDWKQGRQRVVSNVQASKTKFSRYSLLDNTGRDMSLDWQWVLGNQWSGHLGGSLDKALGSYRDVQALVSNTHTNEATNFEANYLIHPRWQASFRLNSSTYKYSAPSQEASNVDTDSKTLGGYYLGRSLERIGIEYRVTDGHFPNRTLTPTLDTAYQEHRLDLLASWVAGGKSQVNAHIGEMQRRNANISGFDYSGLAWRFDGTWSISGKSMLAGSLYRDVINVEYATANHAITNGSNLNYTWQALPKTSLQASVGLQTLDYDTISRKDRISTASLAAVYEAWAGGELSAGLQHETRQSTGYLLDYKSNSLFLNANLKF